MNAINYTLYLTSLFLPNFLFSQIQLKASKIESYISYIENKGQVHDQNHKNRPDVLYSATDGAIVLHLKQNGFSYQLNQFTRLNATQNKDSNYNRINKDEQSIYRLDLNWLGSNRNFTIEAGTVLEGHYNFYLENSAEGILKVKNYKSVKYKNIYKGIDVDWYSKGNNIKYDYIVHPKSNYKEIKIHLAGAEKISCNNKGELVIKTPIGDLIEQAPLAFQDGKKLNAKWVVNNRTISFQIEDFNPNLTLIIDPLIRLWGTFYGGSGQETGFSCTADTLGNVYMAGMTAAYLGTLIATSGSHQFLHGGGSTDAFLTKFNSSGQRLWATYYGGSDTDIGYSCALDFSGNVFIAGKTGSSFGFTTIGCYQNNYGGNTDAFLAKFDSSGQRIWSTYYGSSGYDIGSCCVCDASGNVYLSGSTSANTGSILATANGFLTSSASGFLVKFNSNGQRLWGTYYFGSGTSCSVDLTGNIFMCGVADGNPNAATLGAHQTSVAGGSDAYIVKFDSNGVRKWGTLYGSISNDRLISCATDDSGYVYSFGYMQGTVVNTGTAIATPGTHQSVNSPFNTSSIGFLIKFDSIGNRKWGTFYGPSQGYCCKTDGKGSIYLAGKALDSYALGTTYGFQPQSINGLSGFLAKFNRNGHRVWGTYYGGTGTTEALSCAVSGNGLIYLTGWTRNNTMPNSIASINGLQTTYGALDDAFLAAFEDCLPNLPINTTPSQNLSVCSNSFTTISATGTGTIGWYSSAIGGSYLGNNSTLTISNLTATTTYYVQDSLSCGASPRVPITVSLNPSPSLLISSTKPVLCIGESATLTVTGALTYSWSNGSISNSIAINPITTTIFTVNSNSSLGCFGSNTFTQTVSVCQIISQLDAESAFVFFPNPNNGEFYLNSTTDIEVNITDVTGMVVFHSILSAGNHKINLFEKAKGFYLLTVLTNSETKIFKFVID